MYPDFESFVNSTTAARLNGYVVSMGNMEEFEKDVAKMNLPEDTEKKLRELMDTIW